jgi:hypothetical protein
MIQKLKRYMLTLAAAFTLAVPSVALVPSSFASAACTSIGNNIGNGASAAITGSENSGAVSCSSTSADSSIGTLAANIVKVFSLIVGVVSVIMIIYGGFRYITSGGDSGSVGNAKNTLVYAIVGLIIVALAQLIVHYVLGQTATINQ